MNRTLKLVVSLVVSFTALTSVALAAGSPSVSTHRASSVTETSAILHGTVNPNGARTGYVFQWGLTTGYGSTSQVRYVNGTAPVAVSLKLTKLIRGTVYHFRLVAINRVGGTTGSDRKFKTKGNPPPYAATGPATQLSSDAATVTGVVNPNKETTTWYFQYGLTTTYSSQTVSQTIPAGSAPVDVSQRLEGLAPGTIFHYRLVAKNGGLTEDGADATFMTYPSSPPKPKVRARTRPHVTSTKPYTFLTSGRIIGPSSIPSQYACSGAVRIRFFIGKRKVARQVVPVDSTCKFSAQTVFNKRPGRHHGSQTHLRILIQYLGNGYLARNRAKIEHVTIA